MGWGRGSIGGRGIKGENLAGITKTVVLLSHEQKKQCDMDSTSISTYEVTIPTQYDDILKKFITSLKGTVIRSSKSGIDEALDDIRAGRIHHAKDTKEMMRQILEG